MKGLKTGGRQRGTPNRATAELRKEAAKAGRTPLQHMCWVMNDKKQPLQMRNSMAVEAAPYLHPRISPANATTINNAISGPREPLTIVFSGGIKPDDPLYQPPPGGPVIDHQSALPSPASEIVRPHEQPLRNAALVEPTPDPVAKATSNGADPANPMYLDKPPNRPSIFKPAGKGRNGWMA